MRNSRIRELLRSARMADTGGFTLVEMLIVIALMALIGSFVAGNVINKFNRAKVDATKIQMKQLRNVLNDFNRECGFYPTTEQGLDALVHKPTGGPDCKNYDPKGYIESGKVPKDGFDNDFVYFSDGRTFDIKSLGADKKEGGDGIDKDISLSDLD